jgi:hypothetical protein
MQRDRVNCGFGHDDKAYVDDIDPALMLPSMRMGPQEGFERNCATGGKAL